MKMTEPTKLKLNKACMEALVLYAHGLISLSELSNKLAEEDVSITNVSTQFTNDCITVSSGVKDTDLYFHLSRLTKSVDDLDFPIDMETCVVNL